MFNFIYLLTLSLEMPIEASGQISNLNDYSFLFVTGREMSLIKSILCFEMNRREEEPMPEECAVKVFKTTLNEFKTRDRYIKDDHRFKDRFSKQNPRKIIKLWAEKEMCNLSRCVVYMFV